VLHITSERADASIDWSVVNFFWVFKGSLFLWVCYRLRSCVICCLRGNFTVMTHYEEQSQKQSLMFVTNVWNSHDSETSTNSSLLQIINKEIWKGVTKKLPIFWDRMLKPEALDTHPVHFKKLQGQTNSFNYLKKNTFINMFATNMFGNLSLNWHWCSYTGTSKELLGRNNDGDRLINIFR
jgi:hypothetical protein